MLPTPVRLAISSPCLAELVALLRSWVQLRVGVKARIGIKKIPSSVPHQSIGLRTGPGSHMGNGAIVYGWGRGSGISSTCVRRLTFYLKLLSRMPGGCHTPMGQVIFLFHGSTVPTI